MDAKAMKRRRGKKGEGRVFAVNGKFYLRFMSGGIMQPLVTLKNEDGTPCTNKRDARRVADTCLEDFKALKRVREMQHRQSLVLAEKTVSEANRSKVGLLYVTDAWNLFVENRKDAGKLPSPATLRNYECIFHAFQKWESGLENPVTYLVRVTEDVAAEYVAHLNRNRKVAPRTFNAHLSALRYIWKTIRKKADLGARPNPWADIELRELNKGVRIGFTAEEARAIIAKSMDPQYRALRNRLGEVARSGELPLFFASLFYTGARMGDACRWKFPNLNFEKGRIDFTANKTEAELSVVMHPALRRWLEALPEPREGYLFPTLAKLYEKNSYFVCVAAKRIFTDAGLKTNDEPGEANIRRRVVHGLHSFRHGFGTIATERGASLTAVQAVLGHSKGAGSVQTAHYAHLSAEAGRPAVEAMPDILEGLAPADR